MGKINEDFAYNLASSLPMVSVVEFKKRIFAIINSLELEISGSSPRLMLMGFVKDQYLVSILYSEYWTE